MAKIKHWERILKVPKWKAISSVKGTPTRLWTDISAETLHGRKECHDIFKVMIGENLQPRILWAARQSFIFEGEIEFYRQINKKGNESNKRLNKNDESHTKKPDNMAMQSPFLAAIILKVNKLNSQ